MVISKGRFKVERVSRGQVDTFAFMPNKMYTDAELPEWVRSNKTFQNLCDAGKIKAGKKTSIDGALIAEAQSLEIVFDGEIDQSVLEQKVSEAKQEKETLIEILKEAGQTPAQNAKISTLRSKVEELAKG